MMLHFVSFSDICLKTTKPIDLFSHFVTKLFECLSESSLKGFHSLLDSNNGIIHDHGSEALRTQGNQGLPVKSSGVLPLSCSCSTSCNTHSTQVLLHHHLYAYLRTSTKFYAT